MTIDERIERLTERHEALAQTVELLSLENRETRAMIAALGNEVAAVSRTVDAVSKTVDAVSKTVDAVSKTVDILAQSVHDLVGIVRSHEIRIVGLERPA